ncbi:NfeD family protein [uncultured Alistipes sp.]|jgi:membrane-bound serine protease (clpP class)|uniref:NfeD family protein n=1 Tax=uncultured Alistipes sp. TaxID=538949 RepID=UPI0025D66970|nr:NfeD family protein [uncultured Alistipes sp.]
MTLFYIILLIVLGLLFLVAELVLLPGISIGALLALVCYGSSIYLAFENYGPVTGGLVIAVILVLSLIATVISLRAKTWQRFSLKQKINSSSMPATPDQELKIGDRGTTVSRLSPMGKIDVDGQIYEAKSTGAYVDPQQEVEVVGFENFSVIVKTTTK